MLKLSVNDEVEAFRAELRTWLSKNSPPSAEGDSSLATFVKHGRAWQQKLAAAKWVGVHWPEQYGGRGLSLVEEAVVQEELARVNSPQILGLFGLTMVGPVLIQHGTQSQKKLYLQDILACNKIWCQGFSEPGAGSDLAAVATKATRVDGGYRVTGQKIWTSFAHIADFCFLLCRTSESDKKHQGLSYLLCDMKSDGISTRPLKQISGDDEFNEVFFDEVFVPETNIVGQEGDGWKIAISTLMYERVVLTFARQLQSEVLLRHLLNRFGDDLEPALKAKLSRSARDACAVRALAYRHLLDYASGKSPGPEGSLDKLLWSESFQSITKLGVECIQRNAITSEEDQEYGRYLHQYLYSRGRTIAAGTSEIQRNIIADRVLELAR